MLYELSVQLITNHLKKSLNFFQIQDDKIWKTVGQILNRSGKVSGFILMVMVSISYLESQLLTMKDHMPSGCIFRVIYWGI